MLDEILDRLIAVAQEAKAAYVAGRTRVVRAGESLQAALDTGGLIEFEGVHEGTYVARVSGTTLTGRPGARIHGPAGVVPALTVPPGTRQMAFHAFQATSDGSEAIIRIGANDESQTRLEQEPDGITLRGIVVPSHRGKRAIELHARDVTVEACDIRDVYDPRLYDSQAIGGTNSSGMIRIIGNHLEAGSENILFGGDTARMGVQTTSVLIEGNTIRKPLSWQTDGINRAVKNLIEFKRGAQIVIRQNTLDGCWRASQQGYAIVLTPTRDGNLEDVLIQDNQITNVGGGLQILGRAYRYVTASRTKVRCERNTWQIDHRRFGGTGSLAVAEAEPLAIEFVDEVVQASGSRLFAYAFGDVMDADGTVRRGGQLGVLRMHRITATVGSYGITLDGFKSDGVSTTAYVNGGPNREGFVSVAEMDVAGNTFSGPSMSSVMKRNFPENTYSAG